VTTEQPGAPERKRPAEEIPQLPAFHVARPTLYDQLDVATKRRICLVIAAAGWGKTTALAAWAGTSRTAWLTLDAADAHLGALVPRLQAALRPHLPDLSREVGTPDPDDDGRAWEPLLADVCDRLDGQLRDDLVVVLDNFQELAATSPAVRFVAGLCRQPPEALHIVLSSRVEPPFSVERLRGQGHVTDIDATHLGFDVDDVAALLRTTIGDAASALGHPGAEEDRGLADGNLLRGGSVARDRSAAASRHRGGADPLGRTARYLPGRGGPGAGIAAGA
jgi:LuxR family maltose regulon positive regulatory protein